MSKISKKGVNKRIKQLRVKHFGQRGRAAFARKIGINSSSLSNYEQSRIPPIDIMVKICDVTGADLKWMATGKGEIYKSTQKETIATSVKYQPPKIRTAEDKKAEKLEKISENLERIAKKLDRFGKNKHFFSAISAFVDLLEEKQAIEEEVLKKPDLVEQFSDNIKTHKKLAETKVALEQGRPGWIPVLGRTAAGIVYCWQDSLLPQEEQAVTELNDLVQKYMGKDVIKSAKASLDIDLQDSLVIEHLSSQKVNLVQIAGEGSGEVTEFIESVGIYKIFPDSFGLRIDGDSMSPRINDNDIVILSASMPAVLGQAAIIKVKDQIGVTCKLIRETEKAYHLIPVNEKYETKVVGKDELLWSLAVLCHIKI